MKTLLLILISASALAADLKPNAAPTFDFPELPNTLAGMVSGTMKVARLGAILPSNYSPASKHPLFVYIKGDDGRVYTIPNNVFLQKTIVSPE
jgi:hypothetical protein